MDETTDVAYIGQVLAGDRDAYRFLVDRYKDISYALALSILKHETEAEDAAQEGFIKAYRQLSNFRGDANFGTWLYTIVYRTATRRLKTKGRYITLPVTILDTPDGSQDQSEIIGARERNAYLRRAIAELPETEAAIVTLYYLDENPIATVAKITGLSRDNVKIKLYRSRKRLHRILSPVIKQL